MKYDFSGWATRNNRRCSDGRTILKDAFKENDGQTVPLVWNHQHNAADNVLGHALLENREDGVYAYCTFNETDSGKTAKLLVEHGDVNALSIYANSLKQNGGNVLHGAIKEVSLVLAGANPGAYIDSVIKHGEESDEEAIIYSGEALVLSHSDDGSEKKNESKDDDKKSDNNEETVKDVFNTLNEKQKNVVYAMIGQALEEGSASDDDDDKKDEGGDNTMKHNLFDNDNTTDKNVLSHADQQKIVTMAKTNSVGTLQAAINIFAENDETLQHGWSDEDLEFLFPEYKDVRPGAPELITDDQGWVSVVMNKAHKSPISRIRTRQNDIRTKTTAGMRGLGYKKGEQKNNMPNNKLLKRTTDPQTIYIKDAMNRDDIIDIVDFDVVEYQYGIMRGLLNTEVAIAMMIGDGRDDGDDNKISEEHVRSILNDDELYAIHVDVDIDAAKEELQGTNTGANFGENYVYEEAIISAALYAREQYKGTGTPDFYCTPHLLNVMLLARDLNGRRIYDNVSDLAKAMNVANIYTAEQFEGITRTTKTNDDKKLLGIIVNMTDYQLGSTKGGQITRFNQFDIDFNQEKYLIETRLSGALTRVFSAIVLEEPVTSENP